MLYFAYGSNMDEQRMKSPDRCPSAKFIFKALLPGHRLAFTRRTSAGTGAADIRRDAASSVWGAVYDITDSDRSQLDAREGVGLGAYRPIEVLVHPDGDFVREAKVLTYVVCNPEQAHQPPSREYLGYLLDGAERWGLPEEYRTLISTFQTTQ